MNITELRKKLDCKELTCDKLFSESVDLAKESQKEYNPFEMALKLAKRKKIGPYRPTETRREFRQKDMGTLNVIELKQKNI